MAGDWIAIDVNLIRKREVLILSQRLKMDPHLVVGLLVDFWGWLSQQTENGVTKNCDDVTLLSAVGGTKEFWCALEDVGWSQMSHDELSIPNWDRWMSQSAKTRMKARDRKRKQRGKLSQ